jgi:hypothetical protein
MSSTPINPAVPTTDRRAQALLSTLATTGTPGAAIAVLKHFVQRDGEIRRSEFKAEKEQKELAALRQHVTNELSKVVADETAAAEKERTDALKGIDNELKAAAALPSRPVGSTDGEHVATLIKRQITEQRTHSAAIASVADVLVAMQTEDLPTLEALVAEAIEAGQADVIRRVGRAVQLQLGRLALVEARDATGPAPRLASAAAQRVDEHLRQWRTAAAAQSPEARRQRVQARFEERLSTIQASVLRGAREFGLSSAIETALGIRGQRSTTPRSQS